MTPLELAVNAGHHEIVHILLEHGVLVNALNANGVSPLKLLSKIFKKLANLVLVVTSFNGSF